MPPCALPQTFVLSSTYISLSRCAAAYRAQLATLGCLAPSLGQADAVVVHHELGGARALVQQLPGLRDRLLVGYLVWETDRLPAGTAELLRHFDAIWTPSLYSARSLCAHHPEVLWLPHVVAPAPAVHAEDAAFIDALLGPHRPCEVLQIGRVNDPRKGAKQLREAAEVAVRRRPGLRVIIKGDPIGEPRDGCTVREEGAVTLLRAALTPGQMAALVQRSHFVVSAHHAEGWGLTLTEAMAAGVVPVATGHSGNMTFMDEACSIVVPADEGEVARDAASAHFRFEPPMRWGHLRPGALEDALVRAFDMRGTPAHAAMAHAARRQVRRFSDARVRPILATLLARLAARGRRPERLAAPPLAD